MAIPTISIVGAIVANIDIRIRLRLDTVRDKPLDSKISMRTAIGSLLRNTAMSGTPELTRAGLRITTDIGHGLILGDGLGWTMRAGDMRLSTMGDG